MHIWRLLWGGGEGGGGYDKNEMLLDVEGWGVSECSGSTIFIFLINENWICVMAESHAEPNTNCILLTRNLPFHSDFRQRSHPLMIPLHRL